MWKPVPELISILGVEVPEAPEVSLAGIKADAITLHWTRPGMNKPVLKYLIQVNGVNGKLCDGDPMLWLPTDHSPLQSESRRDRKPPLPSRGSSMATSTMFAL